MSDKVLIALFLIALFMIASIVFGSKIWDYFVKFIDAINEETKAKIDDNLPYTNHYFGVFLAKAMFVMILLSILYKAQVPLYGILNTIINGLFQSQNSNIKPFIPNNSIYDEMFNPGVIIVIAIFSITAYYIISVKMVFKENRSMLGLNNRYGESSKDSNNEINNATTS